MSEGTIGKKGVRRKPLSDKEAQALAQKVGGPLCYAIRERTRGRVVVGVLKTVGGGEVVGTAQKNGWREAFRNAGIYDV